MQKVAKKTFGGAFARRRASWAAVAVGSLVLLNGLSFSMGQLWLSGFFDLLVSLSANVATTLVFSDGASLVINPATPCGITVSQVSTPAPCPEGFAAQSYASGFLGLSSYNGYHIQTSQATTATNSYLNSAASETVVPSGSTAACLKYENAVYSRVSDVEYHRSNGYGYTKAPVKSCGNSKYIFVHAKDEVQGTYNVPKKCIAGANQRIKYSEEVAVHFKSEVENEVTTSYEKTCAEAATATNVGKSAGAYIKTKLKTAAQHASTVSYKYSPSAVAAAGIQDETSLRIVSYDSGCNCWQAPTSGYHVDTTAKVVTQTYAGTSFPSKCGVYGH
jgi:hypothetical protein